MNLTVFTTQDTDRRSYWIEEISRPSGDFGLDSNRIERHISEEVNQGGVALLLGHLRLCGAIPEGYGHDSTEEKLYSKYTDIVIHEAFTAIGLTSLVLKERADVADVECVCDDYGFVADAKAFRLSRTAKNQKDFKVEALHGWKHGKPYALLVCPIYQLPSNTSQIYQQAASRSVCICSYTHLAVLVRYAEMVGSSKAIALLLDVFKSVEAMIPSKNAGAYWHVVNRAFLGADRCIADIWKEEKIAAVESVQIAQEEALTYLARERERIMKLSHGEAIREVLEWRKLENRVQAVRVVKDSGLMEIGRAR